MAREGRGAARVSIILQPSRAPSQLGAEKLPRRHPLRYNVRCSATRVSSEKQGTEREARQVRFPGNTVACRTPNAACTVAGSSFARCVHAQLQLPASAEQRPGDALAAHQCFMCGEPAHDIVDVRTILLASSCSAMDHACASLPPEKGSSLCGHYKVANIPTGSQQRSCTASNPFLGVVETYCASGRAVHPMAWRPLSHCEQ
jgi:hypothetical protein